MMQAASSPQTPPTTPQRWHFELERTTNLSNAFAAGVPSAKVVCLPNVNHYVFRSNEAEVISSMNDFLDKLPWPENLSSGTTRWSQTVAS